jgi:hypothetical protein
VDAAAELRVKSHGHEALRGALGKPKKRFEQRYNAVIVEDNKAARDGLDMFARTSARSCVCMTS